QSQAQPSSSYSERPLSPPPQQSQAQLSSSSARPVSPQVISPPKSGIKTPPPPRFVHSQTQISRKPKPTLQQQHLSAIRIQAAYRGHMVRRNVKGLTGLVRLQGVVRGQNVKRQTVNAMKQMQLLVRVQTQIQSRRIQTLENQALKRQANNNNDKRSETSLGDKRTEMGDEYWDYSSITKEERDARTRKKVEAAIRREKALAYSYSHQVRKGTPTSAQNSLMDIRTGGYPWWWNWLDRQLPNSNTPQPLKNLLATTPSRSRTPDDKRTHKQLDRLDSPSTPMSSRSMALLSRSRTPPNRMMKYSRASRGGGSPFSMKDDDSLMSCPQFSSVPNYMSPTVIPRIESPQALQVEVKASTYHRQLNPAVASADTLDSVDTTLLDSMAYIAANISVAATTIAKE
nr:hypothetical protein [Tanacetum cinerariifolium]